MLEDVLDKIKRLQNYQVTVYFGGDIGLDDIDQELKDRPLKLIYYPAGYVGEIKCFWHGTVAEALKFDFSSMPKIVPNPPSSKDVEAPGLYAFGTDRAIKEYEEKLCQKEQKR